MTAQAQPVSSPAKTCWIVTEGLVGLQNQAKGLAEALGLNWELKAIGAPGLPWKYLPPGMWPASVAHEQMGIDPGTAQWPDVVITAGRRSIASSLAIRKASGGKSFTIHVQDPHMSADKFGCVIVAQHDKIRGPNVLATQGALHHVTPKKLDEARAKFSPLFETLPRPLFSVLVGGTSKHTTVTGDTFRDLGVKLAQIAKETGGAIALTPSRRTGKDNEAILREALKNTPAYIWDGTGENPYFGMLAHADYIVATDDSVSMVSEASSTGKPVYIYSLEGRKSKKIGGFMNALIEKGYARAFTGTLEKWNYTPLNDTAEAAAFARARMDERK
jgi:mitochondrial fission protein ELM1